MIAIVLPPVDPRLHAHAKGHWRDKAKATKQLRDLAFLLAKSKQKRIEGFCRVHYAFFVPDKRRRDSANMVQAQKAAIDGIVEAGMIGGDHWEVLSIGSVTVHVDKVRPRVELFFEAIERK